MLDIQLLRKDPDAVARRLADRGYTLDVAAFAGQTPKTTPKTTEVWTCPVTGEKIADHKGTGAPVVVGKYTVKVGDEMHGP